MSDPYADLGNADPALQERIADAMAARCVEPAQVVLDRAKATHMRDDVSFQVYVSTVCRKETS